MKYLINYAHNSHYAAQHRNSKSGFLKGGFDEAIPFSQNIMDFKFVRKNKRILNNSKGAGYWLWKPYIILKCLRFHTEGTYIFYSDSGAEFIHSIDPLIELGQDITLFHTDPVPGNKELMQTKRDAFILMDCDEEKYVQSNPRHGGFQLYRVCEKSINFVEEYLKLCQDERIITDQPNVMGYENFTGFIAHRHDQSILSLLSKKHNIPSFRDPTQFGNPYIKPGEYPQIINHTRNNN
jgi:hypothetical protein